MSYAVVRMVKLKSHDLKGIQFHNQREKESKTNLDIDKSKSPFNYDLLNSKNIDYNKRVKEIIESQKEGTRKIRKDAVLVNEFLITSDKAFFDNLKDPLREREFFKESAEFFKERYGKQNLAFATVHIDEKTPHLHIGVVPMRDGKLQGKNVFNRQELLAIQDQFPKHMKEKGFDLERGELGSKTEHIEMQRLKAMTISEEVAKLEYTRETLKNDVQGLFETRGNIKVLEEIEHEKVGLFASKSVKMSLEDFDALKDHAKASEVLKNDIKGLKREIEKQKDRNETLKKRNEKVMEENRALKGEISRLKDAVEYTRTVIKFLKESLLSINAVKESVNTIMGFVKIRAMTSLKGDKDLESYVTQIPEEEQKGAQKYVERYQEQQQQKSQSYEKNRDTEMER